MAVLARLVKRVLGLPTAAGELVTRTLLAPPSVLLSERKLARGAGAAAVMSWPWMGANGSRAGGAASMAAMPDTKGLAGTRAVGRGCSTSAPGCASASRSGATGAMRRLQHGQTIGLRPAPRGGLLQQLMVKRGVCPSRQADRRPGFKNLKRGRPLTPLTGCCKVA